MLSMLISVRSTRYARSMFVILLSLIGHLILTRLGFYQSTSRRFFTYSSPKSSYGSQSSGDASGASYFTYQVAVAYQAKDRREPIYGNVKLASLTGEDNYFIAKKSNNRLIAGVADGVGGWAEHGYDSSAISRELCNVLKEISLSDSKTLPPKKLLDEAYKKIVEEEIVKVGGTTAIIADFGPDGQMKVANLGDSWCGVFRDSQLVFETVFQTVAFNAPYQLAIIPDDVRKTARKRGGSFIENSPNDADEYVFQLKPNDIIILATDGVTDNIDRKDMEIFIKDREGINDLQAATDEFVSKVAELSKNKMFPSVFSQEVSKLTGKPYLGGKEDDITVVAVKVN
ncbi:HCL401Wp [Eremothecium sinecaudum]|uniref:Protein phosphatase n=1 Tax=Eremothecium sinecaudum TaxID=45286 RepID=A0A109UWA8_9SACH|nr:HCL401Wp [Eremothecium sinecaudum]AMD19750.1 HCL401Wp [Eremothecium sinecaudum]